MPSKATEKCIDQSIRFCLCTFSFSFDGFSDLSLFLFFFFSFASQLDIPTNSLTELVYLSFFFS